MKHTIAEIKLNYVPKRLQPVTKISNSETAFKVFLNHWNTGTIEIQEEFKVIMLNNSNEPLGIYTLSVGGITFTNVDLRIMFGVLLKSGSVSFITAHNHSSGSLKPSQPDIAIYNKIRDIAKLHSLKYLDNLILTCNDYYSFADNHI